MWDPQHLTTLWASTVCQGDSFTLLITWSELLIISYFSPCAKLIKHYAMKTYEGVQIHVFLTSTLDGREWPASRFCYFVPRKRAPSTHWKGGWVGPRAGMDAV
jgi:hypothetical protein